MALRHNVSESRQTRTSRRASCAQRASPTIVVTHTAANTAGRRRADRHVEIAAATAAPMSTAQTAPGR